MKRPKFRGYSRFDLEHRYFYQDGGTRETGYTYRFRDDTDLPISNTDDKGGIIDPIILSANAIRTFWNSPWGDDPNLQTHYQTDDGEIDVDGRNRAGFVVSPMPDEEYVRVQIVKCLRNHCVGILPDGSVMPRDRHWRFETKFSNN